MTPYFFTAAAVWAGFCTLNGTWNTDWLAYAIAGVALVQAAFGRI